jgi:hypothetical protein
LGGKGSRYSAFTSTTRRKVSIWRIYLITLLVNSAGLVVPSQDTIYNKMLEDLSKKSITGVEGSTIAAFLNEGIKIQAEQ